MSKTLTTPVLRLICFGGAREHTNAPGQSGVPEEIPELEYDG